MLSEGSYLKPDSGKHNPLPLRGIIVMKWDGRTPLPSILPVLNKDKLKKTTVTASADQHLLLTVLKAHKVTVDHVKVARMIGCTPRACQERLKKLRKLSKEWALGDCDRGGGERARGGGKSVSRKQRKKRTERGQAVERDGNRARETLGDIPSPGQEVERRTAVTATDIDILAVGGNAASKAGLGYQDLYSEDEELTPTFLPASPTKRDPSTPPPEHTDRENHDEREFFKGFKLAAP